MVIVFHVSTECLHFLAAWYSDECAAIPLFRDPGDGFQCFPVTSCSKWSCTYVISYAENLNFLCDLMWIILKAVFFYIIE